MSKALVVVESPSKAKTINKYLGAGYKVLASVGHIKDLPKKGIGIDFDNNFEPTYEVIPGKEKVIRELKAAAKDADTIYVATEATMNCCCSISASKSFACFSSLM